MTNIAQQLQTLVDDNKELMSDGFYNDFCSLNIQNYEKENNNLYTIKYFTVKFMYTDYNVYISRYIESRQILKLSSEQVSYLELNTKNGNSVSTCCSLILEDIIPRLNIDNTPSVLPLQRSVCFCGNDDDDISSEDSISIRSFVRITNIEKY